ncbi:MAG TPA: methyltransferase [Candidatus Limnocylindria bacterium]|nr:methyltransferase [Candidatus Limnocylindria bacterium]
MTWDALGYDAQFSFVTDHGAALLDLLAPKRGERILDLGCGTGHQTAELTALGVEALGYDADPAMIARARAEHPGTPFVLGDAQDLDRQTLEVQVAPRPPFDAVLSNAALHWMPDQTAVLRGVGSVLRPGGRFVAEQGGVGNVSRVWGAVTDACADLGLPAPDSPWVFPSPAEQSARLEDVGFRVRLVMLLDRPTPLAPGATVATWVEMFGRALLAPLDPRTRAALLARVDVRADEAGLRAGEQWSADYVRLRFVAESG